MLVNNALFTPSLSHYHRETILPDEDPEKIVAFVDTIKESLNLLANIPEYDQKESENECRRNQVKGSLEVMTKYQIMNTMI